MRNRPRKKFWSTTRTVKRSRKAFQPRRLPRSSGRTSRKSKLDSLANYPGVSNSTTSHWRRRTACSPRRTSSRTGCATCSGRRRRSSGEPRKSLPDSRRSKRNATASKSSVTPTRRSLAAAKISQRFKRRPTISPIWCMRPRRGSCTARSAVCTRRWCAVTVRRWTSIT